MLGLRFLLFVTFSAYLCGEGHKCRDNTHYSYIHPHCSDFGVSRVLGKERLGPLHLKIYLRFWNTELGVFHDIRIAASCPRWQVLLAVISGQEGLILIQFSLIKRHTSVSESSGWRMVPLVDFFVEPETEIEGGFKYGVIFVIRAFTSVLPIQAGQGPILGWSWHIDGQFWPHLNCNGWGF